MSDLTEMNHNFYQSLAANYRLIFDDWHASVLRQATIIGDLLRKFSIKAPATILDCTCGIGTQAIGLATIGYDVHGSDLSSEAVTLAQQYAKEFNTPIAPSFSIADLLDSPGHNRYDVVLSFDNAIAHMLTDTDLTQAIACMYAQLNPDGLLLLSLRDYDALIGNPPRATLPAVFESGRGKRIVYQVWDIADNRSYYDMEMFITQQQGGSWHTLSYRNRLRMLLRAEVEMALKANQFKDLYWMLPDESSFYQPILVARK